MKYTSYLIDGKFIDSKAFDSIPSLLMPIKISIAILGVVLIAGALPITITIDAFNNVLTYTKRNKQKV